MDESSSLSSQPVESVLPLGDRDKHEFLWFDDGTVILATNTTLFRVYRGILSHHSVIFRDMFSVPQPSEQETLDGVPLVHVQDDPDQLVHLLRTLHDTEYYNHLVPNAYSVIAAIFRLSTKYQIDSFRQKALNQLRSFYPDSLEDFCSTLTQKHILTVMKPGTGTQYIFVLARECGATILLPMAYYYVSCALDHWGSKSNVHDIEERKDHFDLFSVDDVVTGSVGRDKLRRHLQEEVSQALRRLFNHSDHDASCRRLEITFANERLRNLCDDTLILFPPNAKSRVAKLGLSCRSCELHIKVSLESCLRNMWNKLPSYYGLEDWDSLRRASGLEAWSDKMVTIIP